MWQTLKRNITTRQISKQKLYNVSWTIFDVTNFGRKILQRYGFLDQSFTRCQNSIQHFHSVWVLEPIYTQSFRFRINTTTRREILKQNLHNDVPFWIKNLTHCLLWNEKFTSCQNFESKVYIVSACGGDEWF